MGKITQNTKKNEGKRWVPMVVTCSPPSCKSISKSLCRPCPELPEGLPPKEISAGSKREGGSGHHTWRMGSQD